MAGPLLMTTWLQELQRILGRPVGLDRDILHDDYSVAQRCPACGEVVKTPATWTQVHTKDIADLVPLAKKLRLEYLVHRCPPAIESTMGLSYDELHDLREMLERESLRLAERVVALDKLLAERQVG